MLVVSDRLCLTKRSLLSFSVNSTIIFGEPILPRAFTVVIRTPESESSKSEINLGTAFGEPILPKAFAVLQRTLDSESSKSGTNAGIVVDEMRLYL
nr:hypothetical protein [Okeania sp. SIO3I5]